MYYLPLLLRAYIGESSHHEHLGSIQIEAVPKTMLVPVSLLGLSIVLLGVFPATFFDLLDLAVAVLMGGA
jgi:NADH:ubiquinone oxidoreductase subunit 4 (subunit M)